MPKKYNKHFVNKYIGKSNIRVIIGGGDGTVLWVVGEMIKSNVDFEKCPIGILPFGTGNDFSRCLGWGGKERDKKLLNFFGAWVSKNPSFYLNLLYLK